MSRNNTITSYPPVTLVATGCPVTGSKTGIIKTSPLGSCVTDTAHDKTSRIGGIAQVMLPGISPKKNRKHENKYAENAVENLPDALNKLGVSKSNIKLYLIGGANVLRKKMIISPVKLFLISLT